MGAHGLDARLRRSELDEQGASTLRPVLGRSTSLPAASVVIRTRNEARHLPRLLDGLASQNHRADEVIVVDSGSTDGTVEVARERADRVVEISPEEFSFGRSLNRGCAVASGKVIVMVSAHTRPASNNWLGNLVSPFLETDVGMVYGRQLPHEGSWLGEARDFRRDFPLASMALIDQPLGNNANSAVREELWEQHAFDEELTGLEDLEWARWAQRQGYVVRYAANAAIVHIHEESPREVYRRFKREGIAWAELFPDDRPHRAAAFIRSIADMFRDARYGQATGAGRRDLLGIPAYRVPASFGFHRGRLERERLRTRVASEQIQKRQLGGKGVLIEGPGRHRLAAHDPGEPPPGHVSIRVAWVGVCATDVEIAEGRQLYYAEGRADYPIVPGHEYSGVVEETGSEAERHLVGKRVVGECLLGCGACTACAANRPSSCRYRRETGVLDQHGAYATRLVVPAPSLHEIPPGLPLLNAVLAEPLAVVLKALRHAKRVRGARAVVVGAGPIGHIATLTLRELGADVLTADTHGGRLDLLRHADVSTTDALSEDAFAGASTIIEATGVDSVVTDVTALSPTGAQVVVLGRPGEDGGPPHVRIAERDDIDVISSLGSDPEDWPIAVEMLASGRPNLGSLTERIADLEDYETAWQRARALDGLKTILRVDRSLAKH